MASAAEIERDEQLRKRLYGIASAAGQVGTAAATAYAAAPLTKAASRLLPFLSDALPVDLAMKGINKLNPKLGNMLRKGQDMGLDIREGLNFIKNRMQPQDDRNPIEAASPDLHRAISEAIQSGRSPIEAAALAQLDKRFSKTIKALEKEHKAPWSAIVNSSYGGSQEGQQQESRQPQQASASDQENSGDADLLAILNELKRYRGGGR